MIGTRTFAHPPLCTPRVHPTPSWWGSQVKKWFECFNIIVIPELLRRGQRINSLVTNSARRRNCSTQPNSPWAKCFIVLSKFKFINHSWLRKFTCSNKFSVFERNGMCNWPTICWEIIGCKHVFSFFLEKVIKFMIDFNVCFLFTYKNASKRIRCLISFMIKGCFEESAV